jgi:hypothetical protein
MDKRPVVKICQLNTPLTRELVQKRIRTRFQAEVDKSCIVENVTVIAVREIGYGDISITTSGYASACLGVRFFRSGF